MPLFGKVKMDYSLLVICHSADTFIQSNLWYPYYRDKSPWSILRLSVSLKDTLDWLLLFEPTMNLQHLQDTPPLDTCFANGIFRTLRKKA